MTPPVMKVAPPKMKMTHRSYCHLRFILLYQIRELDFYQVTVFDTKPTSIKPRKSHEIRHFSGFSASIQADNQHPYENI